MKKIDKMTYASNQNLKERDYWLKKLFGTLVKSVFPYDYNINIMNINVGLNEDENREVVKFKMAGELYSRLTKICGGEDAKLHVIMVTGIVVLLGKYSGNKDIIVGIPIYKQDIDADFINMVLALRNQISHDITFKEMILQVHESVFEAIENQNYPLETLLYLLNIPYSEKENSFPLFDIAVLLKNIHDERYIQDIPLNLIFSFLRTGDSIEGRAEFNSLVYEKSTIERIIRHFQQFLQKSLFDVDLPLRGIDILADEERKQLLFDFNDTEAQYPRDKTIHKLFAEQVEKRPDKIALVGSWQGVAPPADKGAVGKEERTEEPVQLTYKELNEKSNQLARLLRRKGINPDANPIVGIMVEPSIEMIAGIIGILKAGGAYLPLDPEYPQERIKYMLEDSATKILVNTRILAEDVEKLRSWEGEKIFLEDILEMPETSSQPLNLSTSQLLSPSKLAYIIYTSGTTGKPKGTLIEHRNVVRLMFNDNYLFDFNHHDVWTMFHSLCFDFSVWEMYGALLYGGKLALIPKMIARDPGKYLDVLKNEKVTVLNQTPSAFYGLSAEESKFLNKELNLRYIIFGGEALKPFKLKKWKETYPETKLINMYGITETTVHVTFKEITDRDIETNVSNIGKPIPTLTAYILDRYLQPSPIGVGGEICVGGEGVGRGYLNRPELTGEKFIPDPYGPGERIYKSGDLGRRLPDGEIEYMRRIDHQVKVRGFRIELGEIESRLLKHKEVKETVVIARESRAGNKHLCAYVVADGKIAVSDLREYLSNQLPDYMIPSYFVQLEKIPLTLNGKVDRKKLPAPSRDVIDAGDYDPPKTRLEEKLVNIWKNVLQLEQLGVKQNFFHIGGDSIKAIKLVNSINSELQLPANIRIADIYLNETIEKLSLLISQNKTDTQENEFMEALREIEEFKNRIMAKAAAGETPAVLADPDIEDLYPMSDIEKGMIYHSLKEPGRGVYHDQFVHQLTYVDFDPVRFKKAMVLMVAKHPILRTAFHMGDFKEGIQVVHKYKEDYPDIRHFDISGMERQEQEAYLRKFIIEDRQNPFNVSTPSLWRLRTFALDKDNILFLWVFHHAIIDGWSDASFKTELNNIYLKLKTEPGFVPGKLKSSYKNFIIEQMVYKKKKEIRDFWRNELEDYKRLYLPGTVFNDDKRYNENDEVIGVKTYAADLGTTPLNKLNDTAVSFNTNLKCLCFGAYIYMLNMISYENDITAGLVVHNRPVCEDGEKILGCFLNSIPVRIIIPTDIRWSDYIRMVDEKLMELTKYGQLSLFEIAKVAGEEGRNQNPLFDTIFNFVDFHVYQGLQLGDEQGAVMEYNANSSTISIETQVVTNTWFDFTVDTTGGSLGVIIYYSDEWFDVEMVQKCCDYFKGILNRFVDEPEGLIGKDKILSLEEKKQLLRDFNDTSREYPKDRTIYELFEEQAARTPDGIAVIGHGCMEAWRHGGIHITYRELNQKANPVAHSLREKGVLADSIIGIKMERSLEMIIGIMGILKAGGAYLPIDPDYPRERIDYMLKDSNTRVLLKKSEIRISKFETNPNDQNSNDRNEATPGIVLNFEHLDFEFVSDFEFRASNLSSSNLAYIIYTSGTTGRPKGTPVEHRSLVNLCYWHNRYYSVTEKDNATQYANVGFDASVWEIFPYLIKGAALHIIGEDIKLDIQRLGDYYKKHHVTISFLPTQLCQQFMKEAGVIPSLRCLLTGGDKLNRFVERSYRLYNNYGPTENTVVTTSWLVEAYKENIPIGKPINNSRVYILNKDNLQLQPLGVAGELCIAGDSLACGYLNNPELTAEKFLSFFYSSAKIYKTGDLACWLADGSIEFLGRIDHQVKIRGFRLELGEIETRLLDIEEITEAVVLDRADNTGEKYLCAYIVSPSGLESQEIKAALSQMLPGYMIPNFIVLVEGIPLTPGGKVDRKALPAPGMGRGAHYVAPGNEVEEKLAEIWGEVLHGLESEPVGIDDNFFELGGHSLKAITLVARIQEVFNTDVPLEILFRRPTTRGLAEYIAGAAKARFISIQPVEKKEYYELSSAQKRLFVIQQMEADKVVYNVPLAVVLEGELDKEHLEGTIGKLIKRHESLRTSFEMINQDPVQRVHEDVEFEVDYSDLAAKNAKDREEIIKNYIRSFELSKAPLLRAGLFRLEKQKHVFILDMHHIITDGSSLPVLSKEFIDLYAGKGLKPLRIQYKDYAQWQKNQKENLKKQEEYWLNVFEADVPVLILPTDYPRPAVQSFEGSTFQFTVDRENTKQLREVATNHGATLYMVLLGIFNVLLARISGQEDIVVGVPIAGRRHAELEPIIGMFVNTLAIRNLPSPQKTFDDFLQEVKKRTLGAFENQEHQFEDLVEQVPVNRDVGRNPLFDVMFVLQNVEYPGLEIPGLKLRPYEHEMNISKFDLTLTGIEREEDLLFSFEYCTKLFKKKTIERFIEYFKKVLSEIVKGPGKQLVGIEIISEFEKNRILYDFNDTEQEYSNHKTIPELFEEQVGRTPDHIAVVGIGVGTTAARPLKRFIASVSQNMHFTYGELNEKSNQLAYQLRRKGVGPDIIVGLMVERSLEMIVGIMGILKAGGAYLPIDTDYPRERIDFMLKDSDARILLKKSEIAQRPISKSETNPNDQNEISTPIVLDFEHLNFEFLNGCPSLGLSNFEFRASNLSPSNLAYIIYTSGSTGRPKGVMIEHHSLVNRLNWMQKKYTLDEGDTILHKTTFTFDVSVWEIFWWAIVGARICLLVPGGEKDPETITNTAARNRVTVMHFVPSMLTVFLEYLKQSGSQKRLSCLKQVIASGEALTVPQVKAFKETLYREYSTQLANLYGPTEATIDVSYFDCFRQDAFEVIPIGKPIDNTGLYILNTHLHVQPVGIAGELFIAGAGLARGYLNRPELTAEKFLSVSYRTYSSSKIYKTGDLARWLPDSNIEFLGRIDHQVKIRGFRLELGEIETRLTDIEGITAAVVIDREDKTGEKYLCAYIVSTSEIEPQAIKAALSLVLPGYMIPAFIVRLERMPLTPSGKVDRKDLPSPEIETGDHYAAPGNEVEEKLAEIWGEVLHGLESEPVGIDDNFFKLGGHSLKAITLVSRIHELFNTDVPLEILFRRPTIRGLAEYIAGAAKARFISIQPVEKREYYNLSSAQKRLFVIQQMDIKSITYNIPIAVVLEGEADKERLGAAIGKLIKRHESLRTFFALVNQEPVQRVHEDVEFKIEYFSVEQRAESVEFKERNSAHTAKNPMRGAMRYAAIQDFIRPFDLSKAPLLRVGLFQVEKQEHVLILDMHHIITDGSSQAILSKEFMELYAGKELKPLSIRYRDYAQWQKNQKENLKKQEEYWLNVFEADVPVLNLPTDYPRPAVQSFEGSTFQFTVDRENTKQLREVATNHGATLYMVLLGIFNVLLAKISGQEDIVVGAPIAGRRHAELEPIIGMFVNTLAIRNLPSPQKTFDDFLQEVKKRILGAFENQEHQFEDLVEQVPVNRDVGRNPLFDVMFVLQNVEYPGLEIPGLKLRPYEYEMNISKFDLTLTGIEGEQNLLFSLEYCTKLFKKETIERFIGYFKKVFSEIVNVPGRQLAGIEIISEVEKNRVLYEFNNTGFEYPGNKTIHQLFEEQVEIRPDGVALIGVERRAESIEQPQITYGELDKKSNQLGYHLRAKGVGPDTIAGIKVERSIEMIIGILGILKAGGAYLPVDPDSPKERIDYMLTDSGTKILLSELSEVSGLSKEPTHLTHLTHPTHLCYVIYTSGTTGWPKGTLMEHRSLVNLCYWHNRYYGVTDRDHATQYAGIGFDASVWEIFPYLVKGAAVHIIDESIKLDIDVLNGYYEQHNITISFLPTQLCEQFMEKENKSLRALLTGGDKLRRFVKKGYDLYNNYGPTENTVVTTAFAVEKPYRNIPIGMPIHNNCIFILNTYDLKLQPIGVWGELCITGDSLARGYLNRPELTAEKFIDLSEQASLFPTPYSPTHPLTHSTIYRTGDLARWLADGNIEFLGRIDHQVKIRGFRIEIGEIEKQLLAIDGIKEAVAIDKEDKAGEKYLCAYIVSEEEIDPKGIKVTLSQKLPGYMIPDYYLRLDKLPLTASGKVNRNKLPEPGFIEADVYVAPGNEIEERLVEIWSDVLGIEKEALSIEANFFDIGGNSLRLIKINTKIKELFNKDIPITTMFRLGTIREISAFIQEEEINLRAADEVVAESISAMDETLSLLDEDDNE